MQKHLWFLFLLASSRLFSQVGPVYTSNNIAVNGYDVVSYFTRQQAVQGSSEWYTEWAGAVWHFSSAENRQLFIQHPESYAPQYGGFCAYGASRGYLAPTDPQAFTIHEGKLYLNYDLNVRSIWVKDMSGRIAKADKFWISQLNKN